MILYEDNHLLVAEKPAGLPTQPDFEQQLRDEGRSFLHAAHRLDKPTSGIVLFAKSSKALSRLQAAFRTRKVEKSYLAKTEALPESAEGALEHYLVHDSHFSRVSSSDDPSAKLARLTYHIREDGLLEIKLETGRYHQIRAQLAAIGCPIVGDVRYGAAPWESAGIALHHFRLVFPHPTRGGLLAFESPPLRLSLK